MSRQAKIQLGLSFALLFFSHTARAAAPTDLAIRATATSFRAGINGIYTITVSNIGDADTDATVVVTDALPNGLSFSASKGAAWNCSASGQLVTCINTGSIPAGTSSGLALSVNVGSAAVPGVVNSMTVSYAGDTNGANNTANRTTIVKPGNVPSSASTATPTTRGGAPQATRTPTPANATATDLLITNTSNGRFTVGGFGIYFLTVINVGDASTNAPITITDALPGGLGFISATGTGWTCTVSDQAIQCVNPNPLAVLASSSVTLTVSVGSNAFPAVTNIATVFYAADTNAGNNTGRRPTTVRGGSRHPSVATATPTAASAGATATRTATATPTPANAAATDLMLTNTSSGSFAVGRPGFYTLTVTNLGDTATNAAITVTDTLPATLGFVSAVGPGWTCSNSGQTVTCVHGSAIISGGGAAISLQVSVSRAAFPTVTNVATLDYAGDTDLSNNTAKRPTTVRQ